MIGVSDPELTDALGQLFSDAQTIVDEGRADVVLLTARRLACVYELLVRQGMSPLTGCQVVSDRYLDIAVKDDWTDVRVLVLDDSVILGTTLYRLRQRLLRLGVAEVLFRSVVLDAQQHAPYLIDAIGLQPICRRRKADVEKFSLELVRGLFKRQIPYFSDFPPTVPLSMTAEQWQSLVASSHWLVADVTAPLLDDRHEESHHAAYSHIPHGGTLELLLDRLPGGLAHLVDSFKIRSYAEADTDKSVGVVFVPLALVRPIHADHLDDALHTVSAYLAPETDLALTLGCEDWAPEAKHRLLQLFVSVCGLAVFWDTLSMAPPLSQDTFERLPLELHFGQKVDTVLATVGHVVDLMTGVHSHQDGPVLPPRIDEPSEAPFLADSDLGELLWSTREFLSQLSRPAKPSPGELTKIGIMLTQPVVSIFGWIHATAEMKQREKIRSLGSTEAYDEYVETAEPRVLNQGLTGRELVRALMPDSLGGDAWTRSLVMLGIDAGNDLGIVVPITKVDEKHKVVYRCYRLGETAYLADTPLVQSPYKSMDLMTEEAIKGFPLNHIKLKVDDMFSRSDPDDRPTYALLQDLRNKIVPGRPVERFDGEIVSVEEDGHFLAHLTDAKDGEVTVGRLKPAQFDAAILPTVRLGSRFSWTVFERSQGGTKVRSSVVRLHERNTINSEALLARIKQASAADPREA